MFRVLLHSVLNELIEDQLSNTLVGLCFFYFIWVYRHHIICLWKGGYSFLAVLVRTGVVVTLNVLLVHFTPRTTRNTFSRWITVAVMHVWSTGVTLLADQATTVAIQIFLSKTAPNHFAPLNATFIAEPSYIATTVALWADANLGWLCNG